MKPGRNDPCPCGSGKKYKRCCYLTGESTWIKKIIESQDFQKYEDDWPEDDDFDDDDNYDFYDDDYTDDDNYKDQEYLINAINNIRRVFLDKKPHIRKYYKIRKIHSEIVSTMMQYYHDGKFKKQTDPDFISKQEHEKDINLLESAFDLESRIGSQSFYDIWIYKIAPNIVCITDEFIRDYHYRKPEKIEFLHSMLDSKLGLFEVTGTNLEEGYAYLKDVFTGDEYTIVDIGISGDLNYDDFYIYTRIITYQDISFGTGLNFIFKKTDNFIKNHIQQYKKDFKPNGEFLRFMELYKRFSQYPGKIKILTNKL